MFFKDVTTEDTTSANICDFTIKNFGCCNEIYYTNKYINIKCKNFINWFVSGMPSTFSTPSPLYNKCSITSNILIIWFREVIKNLKQIIASYILKIISLLVAGM